MAGEFVMAQLLADIRGVVTCHYPCVPECTRKHEWENDENK